MLERKKKKKEEGKAVPIWQLWAGSPFFLPVCWDQAAYSISRGAQPVSSSKENNKGPVSFPWGRGHNRKQHPPVLSPYNMRKPFLPLGPASHCWPRTDSSSTRAVCCVCEWNCLSVRRQVEYRRTGVVGKRKSLKREKAAIKYWKSAGTSFSVNKKNSRPSPHRKSQAGPLTCSSSSSSSSRAIPPEDSAPSVKEEVKKKKQNGERRRNREEEREPPAGYYVCGIDCSSNENDGSLLAVPLQ